MHSFRALFGKQNSCSQGKGLTGVCRNPWTDAWYLGKKSYIRISWFFPYSPTSLRPLGIFANDSRIPAHNCELSISSQSVGPVYNDVYVDDVISILLCCPPPSQAFVPLFSPTFSLMSSGREERKGFLACVMHEVKSGHIWKLIRRVVLEFVRYSPRFDSKLVACVVLLCLEVIIHGRRGIFGQCVKVKGAACTRLLSLNILKRFVR